MSVDWIESYLKAGKAVIAAKKKARELIKPGARFLEIANKCEEEIFKEDCNLSFPINMSLNEIAAHYSPPIDDETIVPDYGLLKIDLGAHHNGYIADSAITININGDKTLQNYIDAAKESLEAAIEIFHPGTRLYELGGIIEQTIKRHNLNPIYNLGGHELQQNILHAGNFIPNSKDSRHNYKLKEGDCYACEPFSTSGDGWVKNGSKSYIYRFKKKIKKNISYEHLNYMNKIWKNCGNLPFSPRFLEKNNLIPKTQIPKIIDLFVRKGILDHYPILIDRTGAFVAQQEHTIIIDMNGETIVTTKE